MDLDSKKFISLVAEVQMTCLRLVSLKDRNLCFEFTGFSRFAFQISNHIMFMPVYAYLRTQAGVRMYIIM